MEKMMTSELITLVDLDGVCADFQSAVWNFCNDNGIFVDCASGEEKHYYLTDHKLPHFDWNQPIEYLIELAQTARKVPVENLKRVNYGKEQS